MAEVYPLLLTPVFRERVWGARDLRPIYTRPPGEEPIGEVWVVADECQIANGPLAGSSLKAACEDLGHALVGDNVPSTDRFPLLIKFLFPRELLSVQVHPDDERARALGQPCGKTECWYVLRAIAGAKVGLGLRAGTTREQFAQAIADGCAQDLLNWIDVRTGDMIYVDAGTVHAIGPNAIFIETQQNSDTTFRLYDYNRGRELHIEQGLQAIRETTAAGRVPPEIVDGHIRLIASPCFSVERYGVREPMTLTAAPGPRSVQVLVASEGCGVVEWEGTQPVTFSRGEAVVIPAALQKITVRPQWSLEMLRMSVPVEKNSPPATTLTSSGGARTE